MKPEQITAWALDEASAEERQQLEAALLENPQQKQTAEETKVFCDFLLSELRDDSLALTDAQRERLVGQSSRVPSSSETPAPPSVFRTPQTKWRIGIIVRLAVAACVALGGFWTWQAYRLNQPTSHMAAADEEPGIKVNLPQAGDAKKKQDSGAQTRLLASAPVKAAIKEQPPTGRPLPPAPVPASVAAPVALALSKQLHVMTSGDVEKLKQIQDQNAYALNFGDQMAVPAAGLPGLQTPKTELPADGLKLPTTGSLVELGTGGGTLGGTVTPADANAVVPPRSGDPMLSVANTLSTAGTVVVNGATAAPLGKNLPVDLMSAATITTKSGTQATMTVTREFAYPSEMGIAPILPGKPMPAAAAGTVNFGNSHTYTGSTTITGGTLALTTDAPAPSAMAAAAGNSGPLVLNSTSEIAGANSLTVGQTVSGTPLPPSKINLGTLDLNGASTTSNAGGNTFSGGVTIDTGAGAIHSESVSPAPGAVVLSGAVSIPATPREQNTFSGVISGLGANVKSGSGTLTLTGANAYTGTTTINAGTLSVSNGAALQSGGLAGSSAQGAPTRMSRSAGATVTLGGGTLAIATPVAAPAQGNTGAGATYNVNNTTGDAVRKATPTDFKTQAEIAFTTAAPAPTVMASQGAAPTLQFNGGANTITVGGVVSTASTPAQALGALISNPQPDTRYFVSVDSISSIATKDMAQKQEAPAYRKSDPSGESYAHIIENELKDVAREPLSTLSIDVDTASYANVRRFLNQGMIPPPDAVRIEELVNYFPTTEEGPAHEAKEPFGVRIELAPCPWQPVHRLARIAIKGRERDKDRKPSNLVFLVDVSGSMNEPAKLPLVQQSLRMLTEQLGEGDRVTMVVYAGSSGVVLPPTNGEKKAEILAAIDRLSAGGSTHGSAGIKLAYEQAVAGFIKGGVNRVILCTDGDFNVGVSSPEELEKLIKHKAKTGVFLSVLGFGSGNLQDRTMETLADKGNGNYAYIDSLSEARKVLVEQMGGTLDTIAKDVKIQVEFNPAAVRSYRLIGYEKRLLAKEDFNDDTKDAGEIGAGHSVVALYEIVPANLPPGTEPRPAVDSLKYQAPAISPAQLVEAAKSGEMMTVKLRYKEPDSDLSKLIEVPTKDAGKTLTASSDEFKFSAAVASFGLLLRDSSYKGTLSWETVRRLALDGKGSDTLGYRGEFLQLIDKARGLKETK